MKNRYFVLSISSALTFYSLTICAKDSDYPVPVLPGPSNSKQVLLEALTQWGQLPPARRQELANDLFHRSFGGAAPAADWLQQPRACLALWLALTSHQIAQDPVGAPEALEALRHLQRQRVLDPVSGYFFRGLWEFSQGDNRGQAAAQYLRSWLARFGLHPPGEEVRTAVTAAVSAGVVSLAFVLPLEPLEKK